MLQGRVFADFRQESQHHASLFDLVLTIFQIPTDAASVVDLRDSLLVHATFDPK
jgi:hypothetical protein